MTSRPSTANGGFPSVVVTAVEATTALGADIDTTWKNLLAGESGIRVLEDDFVTKWDLPVRIGGHLVDPVDDLRRQLGIVESVEIHGLRLTLSEGHS